MRKMTLLEMVQNILSSLDSDEVNSVSDTVESLQVAEIIKETFNEQFNNIYVPEFQGLMTLEDVNDLDKPNYLKIPESVSKIHWIKYRDFHSTNFVDVAYLPPEEFLLRQQFLNDSYLTQTNARPTCYTMFDDKYVVFNSYDSEHEDTVQSSSTLVYGTKTFDFPLEDDFVPPIDGSLFPLLLAESKSVAFINLKQISSSKEEQRSHRQRIRMQHAQFRSRSAQYAYHHRGPNYARHR